MDRIKKVAHNKCDINKEINVLIEDIFRITLSKEPSSFSRGIQSLIYMEELSILFEKQEFDLEIIEHALFERLLMKNPEDYIIRAKPSDVFEDPLVSNREVFSYLFECYKSALRIKSTSLDKEIEKAVNHTILLITRNSATALRQPELYSQNFEAQIVQLVTFSYQYSDELLSFFTSIAEQLVKDDALYDSFKMIFTSIKKVIQSSHLDSPPISCFNILCGFINVPEIVSAMIKYSHPIPTKNGSMDYEDTLLGSLLSISCIPKDRIGSITFPLGDEKTKFHSMWAGMGTIQTKVHHIFLSLLKMSGNTRQDILMWLGQCISYNTGRVKLSSLTSGVMMMPTDNKLYISDGFSVNLYSLLLNLSAPFIEKRSYSKLYKIDPTYCVASVRTVDEMNAKGIHLTKLNEETCLIPLEDGQIKPIAKGPFSFITECFFMTHKSLEIGMKLCLEKLSKLNQDIGQMENIHNVLENANGIGLQGFLSNTLGSLYSRCLEFRCALLEPNTLLLLAKFMAASVSWVIQVLLDDKNHTEDSYAPNDEKPLTFPLPKVPPVTYACIPEFIVDNLCSYLILANRFNFKNSEENRSIAESLEPLFTGLIVFIGSKNLVRNPHLRARLTEGIECLLPESHDDDLPKLTSVAENVIRAHLFQFHPHRKQLVPALLDIFVGIEMTGETVQFEQKFNYRRPMYRIMEYVWTLEDYRNVFKELAEVAEREIEAVSPPIFLRFINILINDAIFLLDEAISNMTELHHLQAQGVGTSRESDSNDSVDDRESRAERMHHIGMMARFDNILGSKTINTLRLLTLEIRSIFCHPTVVDRIAAMLNYFLSHLVGPKKKELKVKDMAEYNFFPGNLVLGICAIYLHLSENDNFCKAISNDGRSYTPQLFQQAENVLARLNKLSLMDAMRDIGVKVARLAEKQESEDAILSDAPDDYLDPIMSSLMFDPVILPTSNKTVDRSVIARHLLSDQSDPFNRMPLTMDMLVPNVPLKEEIHKWIEQKRAESGDKKTE